MTRAVLDMVIDDGTRLPEDTEGCVQSVLQALAEREGDFSAAILFTDEEEIQRLNREFRDVDSVTDVLSFPNVPEEGENFVGDIAICIPRALEQAAEIGQPPQREVAFLALHGALHLLGYDHETPEDEEEMFSRQKQIMRSVFPVTKS